MAETGINKGRYMWLVAFSSIFVAEQYFFDLL